MPFLSANPIHLFYSFSMPYPFSIRSPSIPFPPSDTATTNGNVTCLGFIKQLSLCRLPSFGSGPPQYACVFSSIFESFSPQFFSQKFSCTFFLWGFSSPSFLKFYLERQFFYYNSLESPRSPWGLPARPLCAASSLRP